MNALVLICRELTGLFVDDGLLALEILAVVALAGVSVALVPHVPMAAGVILLFGCLGVLLSSVLRAGRH